MSYIDYHRVADEHAEIDRRLLNWAQWCRRPAGSFVQPMFRLYRSSDQYRDRTPTVWAGNTMDAEAIQRMVGTLPEAQRLAVSWHYVWKGSPRKMCDRLRVSNRGLVDLVYSARQMLLEKDIHSTHTAVLYA